MTAKFHFTEESFYLHLYNHEVAILNLTQPLAQCCQGRVSSGASETQERSIRLVSKIGILELSKIKEPGESTFACKSEKFLVMENPPTPW